MTETEPHVVVMSIIDTKPFCMLTTIHTEPFKQTEVTKMVYDATEKKKVPKAIQRLKISDDYNYGMNGVDVSDQLAKSYEIGGQGWRNAKWTTAVSQDIIKRSADAAYLLYERQCELDESARRALGGSPAAGSRSRSKPIRPLTHADFIESVAGGLIVTAYNVQKGINEGEKLKLTGEDAADPIRILDLLARSTGTVRVGGGGQPMAMRASPLTSTVSGDAKVAGAGHCLLPIPSEMKGARGNPPCNFADCPHNEACKKQKCGAGSAYVEKGRSRCAFYCPACSRNFHADCCNKYHGWGEYK
jgi:hypothetical protein